VSGGDLARGGRAHSGGGQVCSRNEPGFSRPRGVQVKGDPFDQQIRGARFIHSQERKFAGNGELKQREQGRGRDGHARIVS